MTQEVILVADSSDSDVNVFRPLATNAEVVEMLWGKEARKDYEKALRDAPRKD